MNMRLIAFIVLAFPCASCGDVRAPSAPPPNLIVICVDTLRADALGTDADGRPRMPYLASLARKGARFDQVAAPAPWTTPSVVSLLTGLLPSEHGCNRPVQRPYLPDAIKSYAEVLRDEHGYQTAAFAGGPWWSPSHNLLQGFDGVSTDFGLQGTEEVVVPWAKKREAGRPFFLYLHSYEAHDPFGERNHAFPDTFANIEPKWDVDVEDVEEPHDIMRGYMLDHCARVALFSRFFSALQPTLAQYAHSGYRDDPRPALAAELAREYWKGVAWVDSLIKRTVASLEAAGLMENTLLVVTGDHGEAFGEHGTLMHGGTLYDELVKVPLVMIGPKPFDRTAVVSASVGLIDVLPTFFDLARIEQPTGTRGQSMLPLFDGDAPGRPVLSQEVLTRLNTNEDRRDLLVSLRSNRWKYLATYDVPNDEHREELYDLGADPGERNDLAINGRVPVANDLDVAFCRAITLARRRLWQQGSGRPTAPEGKGTMTLPVRPLSCETDDR